MNIDMILNIVYFYNIFNYNVTCYYKSLLN